MHKNSIKTTFKTGSKKIMYENYQIIYHKMVKYANFISIIAQVIVY